MTSNPQKEESWPDNEPLEVQVARLAGYISNHCPGWPKDGGAIETAVQIIEAQKADRKNLIERVERLKYQDPQMGTTYDEYTGRERLFGEILTLLKEE